MPSEKADEKWDGRFLFFNRRLVIYIIHFIQHLISNTPFCDRSINKKANKEQTRHYQTAFYQSATPEQLMA